MRHTLRGAMLIGAGAGTAVVLTFARLGRRRRPTGRSGPRTHCTRVLSTWSARA